VDQRILTKSVLHQVIDQKFREAEISIAFPQRDVHLDTNRPLDIRIMQEKIETQNVAPLVEQN
jgi:potassium efflux system protein